MPGRTRPPLTSETAEALARLPVHGGLDLSLFVELDPDPVDLIRPGDLVHLRCSFVNLRIMPATATLPPRLVRRLTNRPARLVMEWAPQHVTEHAFFESAGATVKPTTPPGGPSPTPRDREATERAELGNKKTNPDLYGPPVRSSMAGNSRVAFVVKDEQIPFTIEGLLTAAGQLPMSVAPHATPAPRPFKWSWIFDVELTGSTLVSAILADAGNRRTTRAAGAATSDAARFIRAGRTSATASELLSRFDAVTAGSFVGSAAVGFDRGTKIIDVADIDLGKIVLATPAPRAPAATETAIELPWRLILSPSVNGGWRHSTTEVNRHDRVELWHSRLGVRTEADDAVTVDERATHDRTVRAIWTRDFEDGPKGFVADPNAATSFPSADGSQDTPSFRMSLNSRDRMMLVHETSNHTLKPTPRSRTNWVPTPVSVNRLMLSSQGAWLNSRVEIDSLPEDKGLTLEEWKHIATLGRDHEVKVVYAGFLMPFGHRASLVKITQRKFGSPVPGNPAYLYQRMFVIVREPVRQFRTSTTAKVAGLRLDLGMPFTSVHIVTEVTPDIDEPVNLAGSGGYVFPVNVAGAAFGFKTVTADMEGNICEFDAPMYFVEFDQNAKTQVSATAAIYNARGDVDRLMQVGGQRLAFARSTKPDDTVLSTTRLRFKVVTDSALADRPATRPRWEPRLDIADVDVPAAQALSGSATSTRVLYPDTYLANEFVGGEVFLKTMTTAPMNFAGKGERSGGFVTPSLAMSGLSRLTGPVGGDLAAIEAGQFNPTSFFAGISAKLFGVVPLADLIPASAFNAAKVPTFVAEALNVATTLVSNVQRFKAFADKAVAAGGALGAAATAVATAGQGVLDELDNLPDGDPVPALTAFRDTIQDFTNQAAAAAGVIDETTSRQIRAIGGILTEQLANAAAIVAAAEALKAFAGGLKLPETINARLDWSTELKPWPSAGQGAIFDPKGDKRLTLAVEIQAPVTSGGDPHVLVSCSLPPIDLNLIGSSRFMILHFTKMRFSVEPGRKPDVDIVFDVNDGIEFTGPLSFVQTLKDIIPFDGFSDPPYLDVSASGVRAGFDLALPSLAIGVFSLENISLGAHVLVPFIDESLEVAFNFCTRENPFRLTVSLFGGGGFFGVTITPDGVRVLEAALEFGAAISINLGVASGGVSIMAGIYFKMEMEGGETDATLTGYFRLRGEVDVLGLISASIELYMELTYETKSGKAVGRATITVEIEILFFSASVSISAEKKFAGANGDPTFAEVMGLPAGAPAGAIRPWDLYCDAFA